MRIDDGNGGAMSSNGGVTVLSAINGLILGFTALRIRGDFDVRH